jgi:hypothetical protein
VSSAGLVLAALIGAVIARRRTRRAQRTIHSLQSLAVLPTTPIMLLGALLGAATANMFGFTLQLFAFGLIRCNACFLFGAVIHQQRRHW